MNPTTLALCTGSSPDRAERFAPHISSAMDEFEIDNPQRQAAFLAQIGHESGGLHYTTELWGPTPAQNGYEGRVDLGNSMLGDGFKYRGRGLIQVTGRANYGRMAQALGVDLVSKPEALAEPSLAARSAACFWASHGLNALADVGDFVGITKRINGGTNGLANRQALYAKALEIL